MLTHALALFGMSRQPHRLFFEVGKGKIQIEDVGRIMDEKDRSKAGMSVPAHGLFLAKVEYNPGIFDVEPKDPFSDWF